MATSTMVIAFRMVVIMEPGKFTPLPRAGRERGAAPYLALARRSLTAAQFTVFHQAPT
jgi:hypothetical protein